MAHYRKILVDIWRDPDFQRYNSDQKIVFIYLFTNPSANESGIYIITPETIAHESGVSLDRVIEILCGEKLKNIKYDSDCSLIFIKRYRIYNGGGRPELIKKAIAREYKQLQGHPYWDEFISIYPEFQDIITVSQPLANPLTTVDKNGDKQAQPPLNAPTVGKPLANRSYRNRDRNRSSSRGSSKGCRSKLRFMDMIRDIKNYWNDCAASLHKKNIKGMVAIRDPEKPDPKLDSLIEKRLTEWNGNQGPVLAAILNYFILWQVPEEKRKWTYGLWNLKNFLERGNGDNITRFADHDAVMKTFTTMPIKSGRQVEVDKKEQEIRAKYADDVDAAVKVISDLPADHREAYVKSSADLYTENVNRDAFRIVKRKEANG